MNRKWAAGEVRKFIRDLEWYTRADRLISGNCDGKPALLDFWQRDSDIMQRWPIVMQILKLVPSPLSEVVQLARGRDNILIVFPVRDVCLPVLGLLDRAAEIEENLAPDSPQLAADRLHTWVWDAARTLWETRHYRAAVQAAATNVNAHVQSLVGRRDVSDSKLMAECFSEKDPEGGKPRLRWRGDPSDEGVKSMNGGMRSFAQGVFAAVRNPATHRLDELTEHQGLERLAAFSLLSHLIDDCELATLD
ncbi:TIGR02391 family protein [Micromonospora sp. NBC_01405]|uniref:TIGR02391 family protein n=1 Tax=Micromonospora sp. NBC_01405 TaxID=2903589 RepID=UPI0032450189